MNRRETDRWDAALGATLALVGFGLLFAEPVLVTAALIPLVYTVYGAVSDVGTVSLSATRQLDVTGVAPGQPVEVTLTVENTGETTCPALRIVDGVPDELRVTDGSPRTAVPLQPGERVTLRYTVIIRRGAYQFDEPLAEARSLAGSETVLAEVSVSGDDSLLCARPIRDPPPEEATTPRAGTVPTDSGGSGLEFFATRQYTPGDPMNRIDWRTVAKTGEFVTIQYRREQASRTVIVLDCRPVARVTSTPGYPTAVSLSAYAAQELQQTLEAVGVETSVVAVGLDADVGEGLFDADGLAWVESDAAGPTTEAIFRGAQRVADRPPETLSVTPPSRLWATPAMGEQSRPAVAQADGGNLTAESRQERAETPPTDRVVSRIEPDAEVLVCSPLLDNWPVELAHDLAVADHETTVISPNVTAGVTTGRRLGAIHRRLRIRTLARSGVRTVDWGVDESLEQLRASLSEVSES